MRKRRSGLPSTPVKIQIILLILLSLDFQEFYEILNKLILSESKTMFYIRLHIKLGQYFS